MNGYQNVPSYLTEFNKKGIIEYFDRVEAANRKKQEADERLNKPIGLSW